MTWTCESKTCIQAYLKSGVNLCRVPRITVAATAARTAGVSVLTATA
jgi:hypothetical protein